MLGSLGWSWFGAFGGFLVRIQELFDTLMVVFEAIEIRSASFVIVNCFYSLYRGFAVGVDLPGGF